MTTSVRIRRSRRGLAAAAALFTCTAVVGCTGSASGPTSPQVDSGQGADSAIELVDAQVDGDVPPGDLPEDARYVVTVKLKPGISWSDGTPLTSKDFRGGYDLMWTYYEPTWNSLLDVRTPDELTIEFILSDLNSSTLRSLLRANQTGAYSQFEDLYERARKARLDGLSQDDPIVAEIVADIDAQAPAEEEQVSYGPYKLQDVSATQVTMVRNPGGFAADLVPTERYEVYYGSGQQALPLMLAGDLDFSRDAFTQSDVAAIEQRVEGAEVISSPTGTGPALWFNHNKPMFADVEFRQALAYVIDREEVTAVALGDAGRPAESMAGFSDTLNEKWLLPETAESLNAYEPDLETATELLQGLGYELEGDEWVDERGDNVSFTISVPADSADFLAAARAVSGQLNEFGFETSVRGVPEQAKADVIKAADYDTLIEFGFQADPGQPAVPASSYAYYMGVGYSGSNDPSGESGAKGMNWSQEQTVPGSDDEVNVLELISEATAGLDPAAQLEPVQTLAKVYNEQLPVITLYERYTTDVINSGARTTGWLPADDAIYSNYSTSDNYFAIQLLAGQVDAVDGAESMATATTYAQPPDSTLSFYALNSIQQSFASPTFHMTFPPLFWTYQRGDFYTATGGIGESYSIVEVE